MKLTKTLLAAAIAGAMAMPNIAAAYEAGDILVRARIINVNPDDSSSEISIAGAPVGGSGVEVDDNFTLDIDFTYMFTPHIGAELLLDLSSKHDVNATGAALGPLGEIVDTRVLPPTLLLQYHFAPNASFRPYVGAGVNYTIFFDEDASASLEGALGGSASVDLDNSFGLAAQIGADFDLTDTWFGNVDVKYIDIDTEADIDSPAGRVTVDVDIDPIVFGVGIGRRF